MSTSFTLRVNGLEHRVRGADATTTLLTHLRACGLTGTKEACAEGECGACAVSLVVPDGAGGSEYQVVNSCLVLLPEVAGREIVTVEGLRTGTELHPVQRAMVAAGGSQCGYCTPGFVMSLFAGYYANPRPDPRTMLSGNLCRCTGYRPILEAAASMPEPAPDDPFLARLGRDVQLPGSLSLEAHGARYDRPSDFAEALRLRAAHPDAVLLAGGTDLVVGVNQDGIRHEHVIALGDVPELRCLERSDADLRLGAGLTWSELERELAGEVPMLDELQPLFASPLIRNRATLGGNLATASPVGDAAPVLLALDAEVELASVRGTRSVPLAAFFTGYRDTAMERDELLVAVRIPLDPPTHGRFFKVSKREIDDISGVSAGLALWVEGGTVSRARFAFGGVAATPMRVPEAESFTVGRAADAGTVLGLQAILEETLAPIDDVRASAAYRRAMAGSLVAKFFAGIESEAVA